MITPVPNYDPYPDHDPYDPVALEGAPLTHPANQPTGLSEINAIAPPAPPDLDAIEHACVSLGRLSAQGTILLLIAEVRRLRAENAALIEQRMAWQFDEAAFDKVRFERDALAQDKARLDWLSQQTMDRAGVVLWAYILVADGKTYVELQDVGDEDGSNLGESILPEGRHEASLRAAIDAAIAQEAKP